MDSRLHLVQSVWLYLLYVGISVVNLKVCYEATFNYLIPLYHRKYNQSSIFEINKTLLQLKILADFFSLHELTRVH